LSGGGTVIYYTTSSSIWSTARIGASMSRRITFRPNGLGWRVVTDEMSVFFFCSGTDDDDDPKSNPVLLFDLSTVERGHWFPNGENFFYYLRLQWYVSQ